MVIGELRKNLISMSKLAQDLGTLPWIVHYRVLWWEGKQQAEILCIETLFVNLFGDFGWNVEELDTSVCTNYRYMLFVDFFGTLFKAYTNNESLVR